jgi:hypothetical protein
VHPWFIPGILEFEFPLSGKHKIDHKNGNEVKQDNLDGLPEPENPFNPVHVVKIKYLLELLTPPRHFCSNELKL